MMRVALYGASGAGKSQLLAALRQAFKLRGLQDRMTLAVEDPATLAISSSSGGGESEKTTVLLLMGLEIASHPSRQLDQSIRLALANSGQPYHVLYGSAQERLEQALAIIIAAARPGDSSPAAAIPAAGFERSSRWTWACEKCSDPQCEHRLLSDLLESRRLTTAA
jgi:hypothetical protein